MGGAVRLYDLRAGTLRMFDPRRYCGIDPLTFSPDGTQVHQATCVRDDGSTQPKSRLLNLDGTSPIEVDGGPGAWSLSGVLWAPVGTQLVPVGSEAAPKDLGCELMAAGRDETTLLGLCRDGRVLSETGQQLATLDVLPETLPFVQVVDLPGKQRFGVVSEGWLTDCKRGDCKRIAIPGEPAGPAVAVTSRGVLVFEHVEDGTYRLRNLDTGQHAPLDNMIPLGLAASANGARLAIVYEGRVRVHDVADLRFTDPAP